MTEHVEIRSPQAVANDLEISPATLRRWSDEFADFLSEGAGAIQGRSHRRYLDSDVETLTIIKELMSDGMTYEQVRHTLNGRTSRSVEPDMIEGPETDTGGDGAFESENELDDDDDETTSLVTSNGESPAFAFLTNTLTTLSDGQKSILNSQAANRELLGVLLQDNFNLKEENNRLRERILEVERGVAKARQEEDWKREALRREFDAKINIATKAANEALAAANAIEVPEIQTVETNPGCLGRLLGITNEKVITTTHKKEQKPASSGPAGKNHPRPPFPPE